MIKDAIQQITSLAEKAAGVKVISELSTPKRVALFHNGKLTYEDRHPPPHVFEVATIESFLAVMDMVDVRSSCSIWVSSGGVVGLFDHSNLSHRLDRVTMGLDFHHLFELFDEDSSSLCELSQEGMINTFRHRFVDCTIHPESTLDTIKTLQFSQHKESSGKFDADSVALGKSVAAQVTGKLRLPEIVSLSFHPYPALEDELNSQVTVKCSLTCCPINEELSLSPLPGQIEKAKNKARLDLAKLLRSKTDIPVLVGCPA